MLKNNTFTNHEAKRNGILELTKVIFLGFGIMSYLLQGLRNVSLK